RSVDLTGLDDHDRQSVTHRVERDLVSTPLRVLIRGGWRRIRAMTLGDDRAVRVAERRDGGDVHDSWCLRGSGRVQHATGPRDVRLLHLTAALRVHADLVNRGPVNERI